MREGCTAVSVGGREGCTAVSVGGREGCTAVSVGGRVGIVRTLFVTDVNVYKLPVR